MMKTKSRISSSVFAPAFQLLLVAMAHGADVIHNGSFEELSTGTPDYYSTCPPTDLVGWTVKTNTVDVVHANNYFSDAAPDGVMCVDLDGTPGPGQLIQSFATVPGATYELSFAYANNYVFASTASASVRVFDLSGTRLGPAVFMHDTSVGGNLDWKYYTNTFVAREAITSLVFTSLSGPGALTGILLDAVAVEGPAPAPQLVIRLVPGGAKLEVCWGSVSNATYRVEYRSDLVSGSWIPLVDCVLGDGGIVCVDDVINPGESQMFYRVAVVSCVP